MNRASGARFGSEAKMQIMITDRAARKDLPENTPLRRLRKLVDRHFYKVDEGPSASHTDSFANVMVNGLWEVIRSEKLYRDPTFENIELDDPADSIAGQIHCPSRQSSRGNHQTWTGVGHSCAVRHIAEGILNRSKPRKRRSRQPLFSPFPPVQVSSTHSIPNCFSR